jgi:endoglucanase
VANQNALPRWRGFNIGEIHAVRYRKPIVEDDFRWISELGFDFVRIPLSYGIWTDPEDPWTIREADLAELDRAVRFAEKYGLHANLAFHRGPGYCCGGDPEPFSLWKDEEALRLFVHHWETLLRRYRGQSSDQLSINLINEPPPPSDAEMTRAEHERVVRVATAAIRRIDPDRLVIADGMWYGRGEPTPELVDLGVAQSTRGYMPMGLTHYQAPWWREGDMFFPCPTWPGALEADRKPWTRGTLEEHYAPWLALAAQGVGVHCGECGCFIHTPHDVFLRWFEDVLQILAEGGIGYALWHFRGDFGVLDSNRADVDYEDFHGHKLDRKLLTLLQKY